MSPPTAIPIHSPAPRSATFPVSQLDKPSFETLPSQNQPAVADRPQRRRTPTPRGLQFQHDISRTHARSAKIQQTKARQSLSQGQGGGKGKGKRPQATLGTDARDADSDNSDDDECSDADGSWIVDSSSEEDEEVIPTSDPRELEQGGTTFQTQLNDPEFCANLSEELSTLLGDGVQKRSRKTLKEVLHLVCRDKEATLEPSQWYAQANSLPEQVVKGGGGCHLDYEPQPSQKRRFVAPQPGPSKRGRLTISGTPSTVLDEDPNPIPRPAFPGLPRSTNSLLPRSATDGGVFDPPRGLPVSATDGSQQPGSQSRRLPTRGPVEIDTSNSGFEDTQTVPEDTQTVPEDTQTVPEDTQTVPEDTQTVPEGTQPTLASLPQPRASQKSQAAVPLSHPSAQPHAFQSRSASQLDSLSARFDNNERHRARAHQILQQRKKNNPSNAAIDDNLMEDDEADRAEARNSIAAKPVRRKRQSGLNCQPGRPRQAATAAIPDATAYTFARIPYYTRGTVLTWALEAYERRFVAAFPGVKLEPACAELIGAISDRIPGGRTVLKDGVRQSIVMSYGFKQDPETKEGLEENLKLYRNYHENFHMGSLTDRGTHYEHPGLKQAFLAGFFAARHSPCVIYHEYFNPVPVETIILLLVMMETCIAEWRTGNLVKEHLNAKEQSALYDKHLENIKLFASVAPDRLNKMRQEFYAAGIKKFAPKAKPGAPSKATICLGDIRADTPPPADQDAADDA